MATAIAKRIKAHDTLQNSKRDQSPKWDGAESWDGEKFNANFRNSMEWYRLEKSVKDLKPKLVEWMHNVGYSKKDIDAVRKTKDKYFNGTMVGVAACLVKGMPTIHPEFNNGRDTANWLRTEITKVLSEGAGDLEEDDSETKTKKDVAITPVLNIQDRLKDASGVMCEELDIAIDKWIQDPENFDPKEFKIVNLLRQHGAKAAHARYIKGFFKSGHEELLELASGNADDQLREAYRHHPRKHIKKLIDFYELIINGCDQIAAEAKVLKKPRAKKVKPAEQLVAKLKFCVRDDKLGIVSVPPVQLVGGQAAVVYNIKTRKIGYYISKNSQGFEVKGTTLLNFTDKSSQKTLRKPTEQLKELKEQNTQKRFDTWFAKNIKTTEVPLNGRFNQDIIILKVFK